MDKLVIQLGKSNRPMSNIRNLCTKKGLKIEWTRVREQETKENYCESNNAIKLCTY